MIKRMMNWVPLFDAAADLGGGGGGSAVADTPAPAPSGGSGNPGGMWGGGIRHQIVIPQKSEEPKPTPNAETAPKMEPKSVPQDGKFHVFDEDTGKSLGAFDTKEQADSFAGGLSKLAPSNPTDPEKLPRKIFGRYETIKEVEEGLSRSQSEGLRLHNELKVLKESSQKEIETRETRLAQLQAELEDIRANGIFKDLSKEEVDALKKENPSGYADYILEKKEHDRASLYRKQQIERDTKLRQERSEKIRQIIVQRDELMRSNPAEFPGYVTMSPIMQQLVDRTRYDGKHSPFTGHPDSVEFLYYAAKGIASVQAEIEAAKVEKTKAGQAADKARTDAAASASPVGGENKGVNIKPIDENSKYKESVMKAGRSWLGSLS